MRVSKLHKKLFNEFGEGEFCLINREFFIKEPSHSNVASHGRLIAPQRLNPQSKRRGTAL